MTRVRVLSLCSFLSAATAVPYHVGRTENVTRLANDVVHRLVIDQATRCEVDGIVKAALKQKKAATVIGITDGDKSVVYGYGRVTDNRDAKPDGETMFEIASLSKLFTALILADMVNHGEVSLNDPVEKYMPTTVHVPTFAGTAITLLHLANYTSGLPRMPKERKDAWTPFSTERLYKTIGTYKLSARPGSKYQYSNLAYVLLGQALSNKTGQTYNELLKQRVTEPLRMNHTVIRLSPGMERKFALGHDSTGRPVPCSILMGCGASGDVRSTANDMLKFLAAYVNPTNAPEDLRDDILETIKTRAQNDTAQIGLAWATSRSGIVQKTGLLSGYRSFVGFSPTAGVGVVVLTSSIAVDAPEIGRDLLGLLTNSEDPIIPED